MERKVPQQPQHHLRSQGQLDICSSKTLIFTTSISSGCNMHTVKGTLLVCVCVCFFFFLVFKCVHACVYVHIMLFYETYTM